MTAIAAIVLDAVHGRIRTVQQLGTGLSAVRKGAHPHAGRHGQFHTLIGKRRTRGQQDALHQCGAGGIRLAAEQHRKLVTAQASDRGSGGRQRTQALGKLPQHLIAGFMPKGIVDGFESVQINKGQIERGPGGSGILARAGQLFMEVAAVGQARQIVHLGQVLHRGLLLQAPRHLRDQCANGGGELGQLRLLLA